MPSALRKLNVVAWTPAFDDPPGENPPPELIAHLMKDGKPSVWLADQGSIEARSIIVSLACNLKRAPLPMLTTVAHFDLVGLQRAGLDIRVSPVENPPVPSVASLHYEVHLTSHADAATLVRAVRSGTLEGYPRGTLEQMVRSAFEQGEVEIANCGGAVTRLFEGGNP